MRRQEHEEHIDELKARMKQLEAKEKYRQRGCTIERRFADLKTHRGLQRFSGQTPERADAQVGLAVLAHNLRTLDKLHTTIDDMLDELFADEFDFESMGGKKGRDRDED